MAGPPLDKRKDARYHVTRTTERWAQFVAALRDTATRSGAQRAAQVAQRNRETTYARHELGGH